MCHSFQALPPIYPFFPAQPANPVQIDPCGVCPPAQRPADHFAGRWNHLASGLPSFDPEEFSDLDAGLVLVDRLQDAVG